MVIFEKSSRSRVEKWPKLCTLSHFASRYLNFKIGRKCRIFTKQQKVHILLTSADLLTDFNHMKPIPFKKGPKVLQGSYSFNVVGELPFHTNLSIQKSLKIHKFHPDYFNFDNFQANYFFKSIFLSILCTYILQYLLKTIKYFENSVSKTYCKSY